MSATLGIVSGGGGAQVFEDFLNGLDMVLLFARYLLELVP